MFYEVPIFDFCRLLTGHVIVLLCFFAGTTGKGSVAWGRALLERPVSLGANLSVCTVFLGKPSGLVDLAP